jgi:hypothetical protein
MAHLARQTRKKRVAYIENIILYEQIGLQDSSKYFLYCPNL